MVAIMEDVGHLLLQMNAVDMVDTTSAADTIFAGFAIVVDSVAIVETNVKPVDVPIVNDIVAIDETNTIGMIDTIGMINTISTALKCSTVINVVATIFVAIQNVQNPIKTDKSFRWLYLGRFKS
jgi:hypothetical protein